MNEEYLKKVFEAIGGNEKGYNYDSFVSTMSDNKDYNKKVFEAIGGSEKGYNYISFSELTGLTDKKKEEEEEGSSVQILLSNNKWRQSLWNLHLYLL